MSRVASTHRAALALAAGLGMLACSARVQLGVLEGEDRSAGELPIDASVDAPPVEFGGDAGRRDARAPGASPTPGCDSKTCGELCIPCDGGTCNDDGRFRVCSGVGECVNADPGCVGIHSVDAGGSPNYAPCLGKRCGDFCRTCDPRSPGCDSAVIASVGDASDADGVCGSDGLCSLESTSCK